MITVQVVGNILIGINDSLFFQGLIYILSFDKLTLLSVSLLERFFN